MPEMDRPSSRADGHGPRRKAGLCTQTPSEATWALRGVWVAARDGPVEETRGRREKREKRASP
jgi:hypothetical protein